MKDSKFKDSTGNKFYLLIINSGNYSGSKSGYGVKVWINHFLSLTLLLYICLFAPSFANPGDFTNQISWKELPPLPPSAGNTVQPGLASPFAGISENILIVAGGCNFPEKPVWESGQKKYYDDAYALELTNSGEYIWHTGFTFPYEAAYGVAVTTPLGVVCIGGNNNEQAFNKVILMKWDGLEKVISFEEFPSLPFTMTQMAGALVDKVIYLAGGFVDGKESNAFLSLDLNKAGTDQFGWEILNDFPGPPRRQAVAVGQNAGEEKRFYLFSGSSYPEDRSDPYILTDGLNYNPKTGLWHNTATIQPEDHDPISLHGADAVPVGVHHILFIGGINREIFYNAWKRERNFTIATKESDSVLIHKLEKERYDYLTQPAADFRFNDNIIIYHTITDSWAIIGHYPYPAPAGAPLVLWNNGFVAVNGEVKPGVRSPKVYFGQLVNEPNFGWINWLVIVIYMASMLYVGYFFMKREKSTDDFFRGGGRVPWWAAGISIFATMLSAITYMAIPGKTYAMDWKYFTMAITIFLIVPAIVYYYLPFFRKLNVTTAYEYLELRFNVLARSLASILFMIFMMARMALVLFLPSLALTTVTGINIYTCIILMGVVTVIYCTMGGVEAVIWGDVIQGFILMGGAVLAIIFMVINTEGGLNTVIDLSQQYNKLKTFDFAFDLTQATFWVVFFGGIALNLISYTSDQAVIQRYLTTKDEKTAAKGIWLNGIISIPVSAIFYFIGTALFAYFKTNPENMDIGMENNDSIFPFFIMSKMPVAVAGLLIAAIFAATMSTLSANINSLATAFTTDFYKRFIPDTSEHHRLKVARYAGIIAGGLGIIFALILATWNILSLFDFFNTFLGLLASGLAGLFAMGIFFKNIHSRGAIIGFLGGSILLTYLAMNSRVSFLLYGFIGFTSSIIIAYIASLIVPGKKKPLDGLTVRAIYNSKKK